MELKNLRDDKTFFQIRRLDVITYDIKVEREILKQYIALELQRPIFYDDVREQYYVIGSVSLEKLNKIFQKFINSYVVCKKCGYSSTKTCMIKEKIKTTCLLCGHETGYKHDDVIHNLFLSINT